MPYEADISSALQRLREDVFARGDYKTFASPVIADSFEVALTAYSRPPGSIRELLDQQAEAGTHSIIDITSFSSKPKSGAISPLAPKELAALTGSKTPAHAEIEAAYGHGMLDRHVSRRGRGIYIIAHRDGVPDEIFFAGCSGNWTANHFTRRLCVV